MRYTIQIDILLLLLFRKGLQILVEILCDAGCEINTIKNLKGAYI